MFLLHPRLVRDLTPGCPPWQPLAALLAATAVLLVAVGVSARDAALLVAVVGGVALANRGGLSALARRTVRALAAGGAA
jgi:hypothetical protein